MTETRIVFISVGSFIVGVSVYGVPWLWMVGVGILALAAIPGAVKEFQKAWKPYCTRVQAVNETYAGARRWAMVVYGGRWGNPINARPDTNSVFLYSKGKGVVGFARFYGGRVHEISLWSTPVKAVAPRPLRRVSNAEALEILGKGVAK